MNRRHFLKLSFGSAVGLFLARNARADSSTKINQSKRIKRCLVVWLNGGASQLDTFDPKPHHRNGGGVKTVKTKIKGLEFAESLSGLADRSQYLTVIRSLTSTEGDHQRATHYLKTGAKSLPNFNYPVLGAIAAKQLAAKQEGLLPEFFKIGKDQLSTQSQIGFLDPRFAPFTIEKAGQRVSELSASNYVKKDRAVRRQKLLEQQELNFHGLKAPSARQKALQKAHDLSNSSMAKLFDLKQESSTTREQFGENDYGRSLLLASRLLEKNVACVETSLGGWDTHENNKQRSYQLSRQLDQGLSATIDRLVANKLLDSTLIICVSEFGRTPTINGRNGRDHFPGAFSAVLAGGGFTARSYGETSNDGMTIAKNPLEIPDFFATCIKRLGGRPGEEFMAGDRPVKLSKGKAVKQLL